LSLDDKRNFEFEFDFGALLRGDEQTRYQTYKEAIMAGFKTINECRQKEGLEPIEGGDVAYLQAQMTPITALSQQSEPSQSTNLPIQ
jgi:phage portal protein BeeE